MAHPRTLFTTARAALALALAAMVVPAVAPAATGAGGRDALRVVRHVRHLEARDRFGLRERIGGAFYLGGVYCENPAAMPLLCKYNATQVAADDSGHRTFCTIDVRVTRSGRQRTRWHRSVEVCATGYRPAPPAGS
jgi:hypothetical protein